MKCQQCNNQDVDAEDMEGDSCRLCSSAQRFAKFADECGLSRFVDPTGERYVYDTKTLRCSGKKSEETDLMDELWNALATAKGRDDVKLSGETNGVDILGSL